MRNLSIAILLLAIYSCNSVPEKKPLPKVAKEELVMYKYSDMALLMEQMFTENENLKAKVEAGEELGVFNEEYLKIHTAELTDPDDRNDTFESFSTALLKNQEAIYSAEDSEKSKINFNRMVQTCIACHETTCTGPIPRIKKLTIK